MMPLPVALIALAVAAAAVVAAAVGVARLTDCIFPAGRTDR